ncbi:MAG: leucine-rich repeat domain-containing protein, partial [Clostridia bacterium]|nr:leucine-rich repeat domain-containing protein [Clostridia bacterium]
ITDGEETTLVKTLVVGCQNSVIPADVKIIGKGAFQGSRLLKSITIPNGVTIIEDEAFTGCVSLQQIGIPNSVTKIGDFAFAECLELYRVIFDNNDSQLQIIGQEAFSNCCAYPPIEGTTGFVIPHNVTSIGKGAFYGAGFDRVSYNGTIDDYLQIKIAEGLSDDDPYTDQDFRIYYLDPNSDVPPYVLPKGLK